MRTRLDELVALAEQEARHMEAIALQAGVGDTISMQAAQFRKLSRLIMNLCQAHQRDDFELGSPKYWVPLEVFSNLRQKYEEVRMRSGAGANEFIVRCWDDTVAKQ